MLFTVNIDNFIILNNIQQSYHFLTTYYPHQGTIPTTPTTLESPLTNITTCIYYSLDEVSDCVILSKQQQLLPVILSELIMKSLLLCYPDNAINDVSTISYV